MDLHAVRTGHWVKLRCAILTVVLCAAAVLPAQTPTNIFVGAVNGNWSIPANWDVGVPVSSAATILQFPEAANGYTTSNDLAGPLTLNGLMFAGVSTQGATLSGGVIDFVSNGSVGPFISLLDNGAATFAPSMTVRLDATVTVTGRGKVAFNGPITGPGGLTVDRPSGSITTLSGPNDSTGPLTVRSGAVSFANVDSLGAGLPVRLMNAGNLSFTGVVGTLTGLETIGTRNVVSVTQNNSVLSINGLSGSGPLILTVPTGVTNAAFTLAGDSSIYSGTVFIGDASSSTNSATRATVVTDASLGGSGRVVLNQGILGNGSGGVLTLNRDILSYGSSTIDTGADGVTISGTLGGRVGVTKVGAGVLLINGTSTLGTFAPGQIKVAVGNLRAGADGVFARGVQVSGAVGAVFELNNTNQTIGALGGDANTPAERDLSVNLGNGALTIGAANTTTATLAGTITGAGGLVKIGTGGQSLSAANSYTGTTTVRDGALVLNGNSGSIGGSTAIRVDAGAELSLSGQASSAGRLADSAALTLGGRLSMTGASIETLGPLAIANGAAATIDLTASATSPARLAVSTLAGGTGSALLIRGTNLGTANPGTSNVASLTVATDPSSLLVGGTTGPGTPGVKIFPFAVGDIAPSGNGTGFVTYDQVRGIRLLDPTTEYRATLAAAVPTDNVALIASEATSVSKTLNSLAIATPGSGVQSRQIAGSAGTTLAVTSGAVLLQLQSVNPASNITIAGFDSIAFGGPGVIHVGGSTANRAIIQSPIDGSQGIVKAGNGTLEIAAANINAGGVVLGAGSLIVSHPQALGTGPLTLAGGLLQAAIPLTIANDVVLSASTNNFLNSPSTPIRFLAPVSLGSSFNQWTFIMGSLPAGGTVAFAGPMSGAGAIQVGAANGVFSLEGNNTFTGGVQLASGTLAIGHDQALGAGALTIIPQFGGSAAVTLSATGTRSVSNAVVMYSGTGTVGYTGPGDLTLSGTVNLGSANAPTSSSPDGGFTRTLDVRDATLTLAGLVGHDYGTIGGLTKTGGGTLVISGLATYAGQTTVTAGTLRIDGTLGPISGTYLQPMAHSVTVGNGATLAGGGRIDRMVTVSSGGKFAPGSTANPTSAFTVDGAFTFSGGATLAVNVTDSVASRLLLTDGAALDLSGLTSATPLAIALTNVGLDYGQDYVITVIDCNGTPILFGSGGFDPSDFTVSGSNVSIQSVSVLNPAPDEIQVRFTAVPESSTFLLSGAAALLAPLVRRWSQVRKHCAVAA
jgi:fibronectin-binding autotransporter adhesin